MSDSIRAHNKSVSSGLATLLKSFTIRAHILNERKVT
jgi:hypothetical protein